MEIQEQHTNMDSSSEDSWEPVQSVNKIENTCPSNLFQKITIKFDDQMIQKNLDIEYQNPILNSKIFPYEQEQQNNEVNFEQTQQEQIGQKPKQKSNKQQMKQDKIIQNPGNNDEAFFNVVEDDQNENWIKKKFYKDSKIEAQKNQRPLTCPQCFTQVCYAYQIIGSSKSKSQIAEDNKFIEIQKSYISRHVDHIVINESKIIRNKFAAEDMERKFNTISQKLIKNLKDLDIYETNLKDRFGDINVKILISCEQCALQLGFWDANQQMYILFNVI